MPPFWTSSRRDEDFWGNKKLTAKDVADEMDSRNIGNFKQFMMGPEEMIKINEAFMGAFTAMTKAFWSGNIFKNIMLNNIPKFGSDYNEDKPNWMKRR